MRLSFSCSSPTNSRRTPSHMSLVLPEFSSCWGVFPASVACLGSVPGFLSGTLKKYRLLQTLYKVQLNSCDTRHVAHISRFLLRSKVCPLHHHVLRERNKRSTLLTASNYGCLVLWMLQNKQQEVKEHPMMDSWRWRMIMWTSCRCCYIHWGLIETWPLLIDSSQAIVCDLNLWDKSQCCRPQMRNVIGTFSG